jgi:hypothetical protein
MSYHGRLRSFGCVCNRPRADLSETWQSHVFWTQQEYTLRLNRKCY